jgi:transposase
MTIVEDARAITGGLDTHAGTHVAAALDPLGGLLGVREFPATRRHWRICPVNSSPDRTY